MRTIIHVGSHKTGTTSIQKFSSENTWFLRNNGIYYPDYKLVNSRSHYGHHDFAKGVAGEVTERMSPSKATDFISAIVNTRGKDTVFLSAEPIYRLRINNKQRTGSSSSAYWEGRDEYVKQLAEVTRPLNPEIVIVFRRQDDFARSLYQEEIKISKFSRDFRAFLNYKAPFFNYLAQVELFKKHFPIVHIRIFEDLVSGRDLIGNFFSSLGFDLDLPSWNGPRNDSLPFDIVEYKRLLNSTELRPEIITKISRHLVAMHENSKKYQVDKDIDWIPANEMQDFFAKYTKINRQIYNILENKPERGELFPPCQPRSQVYPGLDLLRFNEINSVFLEKILRDKK